MSCRVPTWTSCATLARPPLWFLQFLSAARNRQQHFCGAHHQSNKDLLREGMKGTLGTHGRRSIHNFDVRKIPTGDEGTFSQRFSAESRAAQLPTHLHESTDAAWHWSVQLPAILASINHRPVQRTCGTTLLDGLFQLSKAPAHFPLTVWTAPPLPSSSKSVAPLPKRSVETSALK